MTLLDTKKGIAIKIMAIPGDINRAKFIRFGIGEDSIVVAERLKVGPVLVNENICVGRNLAKRIIVEEV